MHDAFVVGCGKTIRHLDGVFDGLARRQQPGLQPLAQRAALEQLGDHVVHDSGRTLGLDNRGTADVVHRKDVGMTERRSRVRFLLEPAESLRIVRERRCDHLDGDVALEPGVTRTIHLAHASCTERRNDFVGAEASAGGEHHSRGSDNGPIVDRPVRVDRARRDSPERSAETTPRKPRKTRKARKR